MLFHFLTLRHVPGKPYVIRRYVCPNHVTFVFTCTYEVIDSHKSTNRNISGKAEKAGEQTAMESLTVHDTLSEVEGPAASPWKSILCIRSYHLSASS
jgi:hypothetical protein